LQFGDVDFDKSNIDLKKKLYIIEGKTIKNQEVTLKLLIIPTKPF
jgi:hypothetical protein